MWAWGRLNPDRSSTASIPVVWGSSPVFNAPINVDDRFIDPTRVVGCGGIEIPVGLGAARPRHHIVARSAAEILAHRDRQRPVVYMRVGLAWVFPGAVMAEICRPQ